MTNWAGNVRFVAQRLHRPSTVEELRRVVAGSRRVRALGTGHSFSRVADSGGDLVCVAGLPPSVQIDAERASVTVAAGVRYGDLAAHLHAAGYALRNLGSLPHISVAGACATGTHGSGDRNGGLATAVSGIELVTADGEMIGLSRADGERFRGAVVGLGALGVVTRLTLDIVPTFDIAQYVYEDMPRVQLDEHFTDIMASAYSVSLFTRWTSSGIDQVWLKRRVDEVGSFTLRRSWMGATLADGPRHPVPGMPAANCTQQLGVPGPWHARLPHFRMEFTPSSGEELQSEYLIPRDRAVEGLSAITAIRDRVAAVLQVSEIRTVAADELWMSPSCQRDSVAIHFTWIRDERAVAPVIAAVEEQLAPFDPRPHWGKLFAMGADVVRGRYQRLPDFQRLVGQFDPDGKFRNDMLDPYVTIDAS
ncbi:MAG TPA: FAD-binding protein [Jiangellales bacterium]|nr:FAD-binding protein [Jiangellales bacterium]